MKVLVIDDDEAITEFVSWALTDDGHDVALASNGAVALKLLDEGPLQPDVILLDMRMPVMDGWQFADLYRKRSEALAPIVVLTAAQDAARRAREISAAAYLGKPFDVADLLRVINDFGLEAN